MFLLFLLSFPSVSVWIVQFHCIRHHSVRSSSWHPLAARLKRIPMSMKGVSELESLLIELSVDLVGILRQIFLLSSASGLHSLDSVFHIGGEKKGKQSKKRTLGWTQSCFYCTTWGFIHANTIVTEIVAKVAVQDFFLWVVVSENGA